MIGRPGDPPVTRQQIKPGTVRRIVPYAKPYRWSLALVLSVTGLDAIITAISPLLLGFIIDKGIIPHRIDIVIGLALALAVLALVDALANLIQVRLSSRIGQGLIYDLRTEVFGHVQQQPLAFFTRSQTGSLISRLNTDVLGAQQAITTLLSQSVDTILTLIVVVAAMFYLSWQVSILALIMVPLFLFPGRVIGKKLARLAREAMQLNAKVSSLMNERFNVAGAMLVKLYGRPGEESAMFATQADMVRRIGVQTSVTGRVFGILMSLISALTLSLAYGLGGILVIDRALEIGTLVALITLIGRLYGPINQLSNMQINVLTALVSFDRVFEILDLKPIVADRPDAAPLPANGNSTAPDIEFDRVSFRYPTAREVSLASLESIALPMPERGDDEWILREVSFRVPAGRLTALVGPSGAGKTTITHLVPRFYDPGSGVVRIDGHDLRELTLDSLHDTVGVVTQDAHLFHDTIRANLLYARPGANEHELTEACKAAQIWDMIASLSNGLDTVVGDRGYRLSGGEKQRVALARLLLKAPPVVVLDEATAHLDSESEEKIQRALKMALAGRTSLVIAHRLSTVREADQILVIDGGQISQHGTHEELLAAGGLYAELYRTQFSRQATDDVGLVGSPAVSTRDEGPRGPRVPSGANPGQTGASTGNGPARRVTEGGSAPPKGEGPRRGE
jgi:ATP-binding cassette, subfamily B, bacterial